MISYRRAGHFDRAHVNRETGEFKAAVFTSGEASDGHILNIRGGEIPDDIPLFIGHFADPVEQLGTLRPLEVTDTAVVMRGQVEMAGDGAFADIRRDLLLKIANGHLKRMSGRWDAVPEHVVRRVDLPTDHAAFVDIDGPQPQVHGVFFDQWTAVEGSIVGIGADPAATMRWARSADLDGQEAVGEFWRAHAQREAIAGFESATKALLDAGMSAGDIVESLQEAHGLTRDTAASPLAASLSETLGTITGQLEDLIVATGERETSREEPELQETERDTPAASLPAVTMHEIATMMRAQLADTERRQAARVTEQIDAATGKVKR